MPATGTTRHSTAPSPYSGLPISRYDHLVTYDGLPTKQKLEMLSREHGLPRGLHGFVNEMKQLYTTELIHQRCRPTFAMNTP